MKSVPEDKTHKNYSPMCHGGEERTTEKAKNPETTRISQKLSRYTVQHAYRKQSWSVSYISVHISAQHVYTQTKNTAHVHALLLARVHFQVQFCTSVSAPDSFRL
jgi:hypothetical protein